MDRRERHTPAHNSSSVDVIQVYHIIINIRSFLILFLVLFLF